LSTQPGEHVREETSFDDTEPGPESAGDALGRARAHGRAAVAEALAALRALLDATALLGSGAPAASHRLLAPLASLLQRVSSEFEGDSGVRSDALLDAVADALDAEIARWEARASEDGDARAVLRALLGLRELLWEVGVRRRARPEHTAEPERSGPRVQRVPVES